MHMCCLRHRRSVKPLDSAAQLAVHRCKPRLSALPHSHPPSFGSRSRLPWLRCYLTSAVKEAAQLSFTNLVNSKQFLSLNCTDKLSESRPVPTSNKIMVTDDIGWHCVQAAAAESERQAVGRSMEAADLKREVEALRVRAVRVQHRGWIRRSGVALEVQG